SACPLFPARERQYTRVIHRSRVVILTREARGGAPRVLTAHSGLDRSPADDDARSSSAGEIAGDQRFAACARNWMVPQIQLLLWRVIPTCSHFAKGAFSWLWSIES